jgi:hypothetical protein
MSNVTDRGHYNSWLQCYVQRISYDYALRTGEVWMPEESCADMDGVITWFGDIDDGIRTIITWAGGKMDTTYIKDDDGKWTAVHPQS